MVSSSLYSAKDQMSALCMHSHLQRSMLSGSLQSYTCMQGGSATSKFTGLSYVS